jgi:hypothetical protein
MPCWGVRSGNVPIVNALFAKSYSGLGLAALIETFVVVQSLKPDDLSGTETAWAKSRLWPIYSAIQG